MIGGRCLDAGPMGVVSTSAKQASDIVATQDPPRTHLEPEASDVRAHDARGLIV